MARELLCRPQRGVAGASPGLTCGGGWGSAGGASGASRSPRRSAPAGACPLARGAAAAAAQGATYSCTPTRESGSPTPHHMGRSAASKHRSGASTSSLGVTM
jgi:hypothetical protein